MITTIRKRLIIFAFVTSSLLLPVHEGYSANLRVTPSLSFTTAYDTNVFIAARDEKADIVFRATPALALTLDVNKTPVTLNAGFDILRYAKYNELDSDTTSKYITLFLNQPIQVSPYLFIHPSGHYIETKDSIRKNDLTRDINPAVPPPETAIIQRTGLRDYGGGLGITYLLGAKSSFVIKGDYLRREFTENGPGLVDSHVFNGGIDLDHRINPISTYGIFFSTTLSDFDDGTNARIYAGGLSGRYLISELYTLNVRVGASHAQETIAQQEFKEWSPYGYISLVYSRQDFLASLLGLYALSGEGSFGHATKRGSVVLTFSDRFAPTWKWNLSGTYQNNRSIDPLETENIDVLSGSGSISHEITDWATILLSGSIETQRSHGPLSANIDRSVVYLGFVLGRTYTIF